MKTRRPARNKMYVRVTNGCCKTAAWGRQDIDSIRHANYEIRKTKRKKTHTCTNSSRKNLLRTRDERYGQPSLRSTQAKSHIDTPPEMEGTAIHQVSLRVPEGSKETIYERVSIGRVLYRQKIKTPGLSKMRKSQRVTQRYCM